MMNAMITKMIKKWKNILTWPSLWLQVFHNFIWASMSVVTINCVVFACALMPWQTQTIQGTDINKVTRSSPAPSNFHVVHPPCARQVMRRAPRPPLSKTTISDNSAMPRLMVSHGSCFRPEKTERCAAFSFLPTSCICKAGQCRYRCNPSGWRDSASHINIH